jgi:hypothetical protein
MKLDAVDGRVGAHGARESNGVMAASAAGRSIPSSPASAACSASVRQAAAGVRGVRVHGDDEVGRVLRQPALHRDERLQVERDPRQHTGAQPRRGNLCRHGRRLNDARVPALQLDEGRPLLVAHEH